MLPRRRDRARVAAAVETVRDSIEILAILAAGIWAIYTFLYENRIKPAHAPPNLVFSATLHRLGQHDALTAVRLQVSVKNVGATKVQFLGYAYYVQGMRVIPTGKPTYQSRSAARDIMAADYRLSARTTVWRLAYVTTIGNPSVSSNFFLDPGSGDDRDYIFYVKKGRFDELSASLEAVYTKDTNQIIPTTMSIDGAGVPTFSAQGNDNERQSNELAHLDLNAP